MNKRNDIRFSCEHERHDCFRQRDGRKAHEDRGFAGTRPVFGAIEKIPALQLFGSLDLQRIRNFSEIRRYEPEESIIVQGSFDTWVYFLVSGAVSVVKDGEVIDVLRRTGDIFGEMCIIDGEARSASIVAKTPAICLATDVSFVDTLGPDDKAAFCAVLYRIIAEVLARRLRETSAELVQAKKEIVSRKK